MEQPEQPLREPQSPPPQVAHYWKRFLLAKMGLFFSLSLFLGMAAVYQRHYETGWAEGAVGIAIFVVLLGLLLSWKAIPRVRCPVCGNRMHRETGVGKNGPQSYLLVCPPCRMFYDLDVGED